MPNRVAAIQHCKTIASDPDGRHAVRALALDALLRALGIHGHRIELVDGVFHVGGTGHHQNRLLGGIVRDAVDRRPGVASQLKETSVLGRCQIQPTKGALLDVVEKIAMEAIRWPLALQLEDDHPRIVTCHMERHIILQMKLVEIYFSIFINTGGKDAQSWMSCHDPESIVLPSEGIETGAFSQIPNANALVLRIGQDELLARVEKNA